MHSLTLGDVAHEHARTYADETATVCHGARVTYRELDERVNRLACQLAAHGISAGGRVLWLGQNCHRVLELLLAAGKLGAMVCPVNWRQSADELAFVIDDLAPGVVVWQEEALGDVTRKAREQAAPASALWLTAGSP